MSDAIIFIESPAIWAIQLRWIAFESNQMEYFTDRDWLHKNQDYSSDK